MQDNIVKCRMNENLYKDLLKYCAKHKVSVSQVIRNAISFTLKVDKKKEVKTEDLHEWMADVYKNI